LCQTFNIPIIVAQASSLNTSIRFNGSKEEVGRKLRRFFFEQTLMQHNAHAIALAHHLNDQQETFFVRLLRGSSLNGLLCMSAWDGHYLRPLLDRTKDEILEFLHAHKITYLTDPTNISNAFLRNRIRQQVLPALKACDSRLDESFQSTLEQLKQEDEFLTRYTSTIFSTLFTKVQPLQGDLKQFRAQDPVIQRRLLLQWLIAENIPFTPSTGLLEEILRFLLSEHGGNHHIGTTATICKKQSRFWIER